MEHKKGCRWLGLTGHLSPELCPCQQRKKKKPKKSKKPKFQYRALFNDIDPRVIRVKRTDNRTNQYDIHDTFQQAKEQLLSRMRNRYAVLRNQIGKVKKQKGAKHG